MTTAPFIDIYLVRHGEAAAGWGQSPDPGLSELGRQEAQEAAQALRLQLHDDAQLVSSPLLRAIETAAPLAEALNKTARIDQAFREIPSPVPLAQRQAWLRSFMQQNWRDQSGDLQDWRRNAFSQLSALTEPTVIFTHFLVINAIVGQVLERPETLCFWPANASITQFRLIGSKLELIQLGRAVESHVN